MSRRHLLASALVLAGTLTAPIARAQAPESSTTAKVSAEALFEEGRRLMADGKATDACPKFAESQRLDPSPATLLNLANCYEKSGRPATAWATYKQGASSAAAMGRPDLTATAERHADQLLPQLPRVSITVPTPTPGMAVALDGVDIGRAEWGIAVPIDPGEHSVDVAAPHAKTWSTNVNIPATATTTTVTVPPLEATPVETTPPPLPVTPAPAPAPAPAPPPDDSAGRTQRTIGLVVGAVGVVGLGIGAGFAAGAKSAYNGSLSQCETNAPDQCSAAGVSQRNSALTDGNVATVSLIIGAAAVAGGVVLWLTAPTNSEKPHAQVGLVPTLSGGALRATW